MCLANLCPHYTVRLDLFPGERKLLIQFHVVLTKELLIIASVVAPLGSEEVELKGSLFLVVKGSLFLVVKWDETGWGSGSAIVYQEDNHTPSTKLTSTTAKANGKKYTLHQTSGSKF